MNVCQANICVIECDTDFLCIIVELQAGCSLLVTVSRSDPVQCVLYWARTVQPELDPQI